ncbi:MAG TPA: hypothetical protein PL016_06465 [Kiritimatiellia bacterium]|nr:hypothetical protein [Kiritimatiellia bacterium]
MKKMMLSIAGVMSALAVSAVNISADIAKAAYYTNATVITLTNSQRARDRPAQHLKF